MAPVAFKFVCNNPTIYKRQITSSHVVILHSCQIITEEYLQEIDCGYNSQFTLRKALKCKIGFQCKAGVLLVRALIH